MNRPRLYLVVGSPGSGKDILVRAVYDFGSQHAEIVPKHTSRARRKDDGPEMICPSQKGFALDKCEIVYVNFGTKYGIESNRIWRGLHEGISQVLVVSNVDAINTLRSIFGSLVVLLYVHSEVSPEKFKQQEKKHGNKSKYIERRMSKYRMAFDAFLTNYLAFDHVLIYADVDEDLYDQIFRLFRAYENREL